MRYELFLRRPHALSDDELKQADAQVEARSTDLACEPFVGDQSTQQWGIDIGVDAELPNAATLLFKAALELAASQSLSIYDPQLGRIISEADADEVAQKLSQFASFSEAALLEANAAPQLGSRASKRIWLYIGGLIVVAFVLMRALQCAV